MPNHPYDNAGPPIAGLLQEFTPKTADEARDAAIDDQSAFDKLGPLSRKAMKESPIKWSASRLLEMVSGTRGAESVAADAWLARQIKAQEPAICRKIRVTDEQSLRVVNSKNQNSAIYDRAVARSRRVQSR